MQIFKVQHEIENIASCFYYYKDLIHSISVQYEAANKIQKLIFEIFYVFFYFLNYKHK
jgi:hypothetical protein